MRITWVTRSFLDYRIPVYEEIDRLCGNQLTVVFYADVVPQRCQVRLEEILGIRAVGLYGELRLGGKKIENQAYANTGGLRIPWRPGLTRLIKKSNPEVIISDGFFQWTNAALLVNLIWKIPHVMCYERTIHTERGVSRFRTIGRKLAAKYIDAICCNGGQTKEYLINLGFPEDRLFIGNMAADYKGLHNSKIKLLPADIKRFKEEIGSVGKVFLYVGQIIPRKGIIELLNGWRQFTINGDKTSTLILLGGGFQEEEAKTYISVHNLLNVRITGPVDYSDVVKYYAVADIFIMPTLEDNWSLVVPEAMSIGLPIICSKYNGCWPELVKPENGWVFDPLDQKNFVNTLKEAWDMQGKWEAMGKQSLRIVQDYTPEKVAGNIFNTCLAVLEQ